MVRSILEIVAILGWIQVDPFIKVILPAVFITIALKYDFPILGRYDLTVTPKYSWCITPFKMDPIYLSWESVSKN